MNAIDKKWLFIGSLNGAVAVALGALASHYLKERIPAESLANFKLASQYQLVHALLMLIMASLCKVHKGLYTGLYALLLGIVFFSGSIYLLSSKIIAGTMLAKVIGPITPIGGLLLIFSWLWLGYVALKKKDA